jgi:capsular polysaccharide biosynthesis protein
LKAEVIVEVQNDEIDLRDVVKVIKKRWMLIVFPALIAALFAGIVVHSMPKKYESYSLLRIGHIGATPFESIASIKEIMNSSVVRQEVVGKLKDGSKVSVDTLNDRVKYEELSDLLKIRASGSTPEKAEELAQASTDLLLNRHQILYANAQKDVDQTLKYIKNTVSPVPLGVSMNDMRIEPTRLEVPPVINNKPLPNKAKVAAIAVFFALMLLDILIAFYIEGEEK